MPSEARAGGEVGGGLRSWKAQTCPGPGRSSAAGLVRLRVRGYRVGGLDRVGRTFAPGKPAKAPPGFPGGAGSAPEPPRLQPPQTPLPSGSLPHPSGQAPREPRGRCGAAEQTQTSLRAESRLPGLGRCQAQNKCVFHALGLFRRICGGCMKPPSQVGIPSGLPRPRGPDVLPALGGAGAEAPDGSPPRPERQRRDSGSFRRHVPPASTSQPLPRALTRRTSLGEATRPAGFVRFSAKWNCGPQFQKFAQF